MPRSATTGRGEWIDDMYNEDEKAELKRLVEQHEDKEREKVAQWSSDDATMKSLENALTQLRCAKPDERSEKARRYAIVITQIENSFAYFKTFVIDECV